SSRRSRAEPRASPEATRHSASNSGAWPVPGQAPFASARCLVPLDSPATGASMLRAMESLDTRSLMPIGRFARLTGLSVKALRHYDELGLLPPAAVDPETGYRSYATAQVERAEAIRLLRQLELPLD